MWRQPTNVSSEKNDFEVLFQKFWADFRVWRLELSSSMLAPLSLMLKEPLKFRFLKSKFRFKKILSRFTGEVGNFNSMLSLSVSRVCECIQLYASHANTLLLLQASFGYSTQGLVRSAVADSLSFPDGVASLKNGGFWMPLHNSLCWMAPLNLRSTYSPNNFSSREILR